MKTLQFAMTQDKAKKRLLAALHRLGATRIDFDLLHTFKEGDKAYVEFAYKDTPYHFEYSRQTASYFKIEVPNAKDLFVALVITIEDIVKNAQRGIYDFSRFAEGFKALPHIELPGWVQVLQLEHTPKSYSEVEAKYKQLVIQAYNPNSNPEGFRILEKAREQAKAHFGVRE